MKAKFFTIVCFLTLLTSSCSTQIKISSQSTTPSPNKAIVAPTATNAETQGIIPLIFSHDGAPDDISTMLFISKIPSIRLLGVVMSYGEQHPSIAINKWQSFLYEVLKLDEVPIAAGSETPLDPVVNAFPQGWRDAADNFMGLDLPATGKTADPRAGYQLIIDLVKSSSQPVTMLVTGAHTDLALALQADPSIAENIREIVVMGGAFHRQGNLSEAGSTPNRAAEWNIFVDPLAAKFVFNAGIPLTVVPLDGSDDLQISRSMRSRLSSSTDPGVQLIGKAWDVQFDWWNGEFKLWDIAAAAALVHADFFIWEFGQLDVIAEPGSTHGQTLKAGESQISRFAVACDFPALRENIISVYLSDNE